MGRLSGKVALITGGSRGQGASHAKRFIEEGGKVVLTDVLVNEGEALATALGENALFLKHDVTQASEWEYVVKTTEEKFGPITILVNNAGIAGEGNLIENTPEDSYMKVININQNAVFLGMKYAIPSMKKTTNGSIINISSVAGLKGSPNLIAYTASKFAVRGMTKAAAAELAPFGIRVNSVHPGFIVTPMIAGNDVDETIAKELEAASQIIPMKRMAQPEEVSDLVLFLASDESSYSTGSEFVIDGGLMI